MKAIKTLLVATALLTATIGTPAISANPIQISSKKMLEVTQQMVINYEVNELRRGLVTQPETQDGGLTWVNITRDSEGTQYITTVYTDGESIVGHDDIIID